MVGRNTDNCESAYHRHIISCSRGDGLPHLASSTLQGDDVAVARVKVHPLQDMEIRAE